MTLPRFWAFLAVALPVLAALVASLSTVDLTYQLRAGAEILATASIPTTDTWTFTVAGQPWFDQQWGAQVILSAVFQVGGWTGLALLRAGLLGVIVVCLFVVARRAGLADRGAALVTIGAFIIAAPAMALRPQLFGMTLFAVVLLILSDRRAHPARCWLIPVIVLVWANLHGSFFLGPLVVGLAWIADVRDRVPQPHRLLAVAVVSALAACVTPFGPAVWTYAASLSVDPFVTQRISEWQRTSLRRPGRRHLRGLARRGPRVAVGSARRRPTPDADLARRVRARRALRDPGRRLVGTGDRPRRVCPGRRGRAFRPARDARHQDHATAQPRPRRRSSSRLASRSCPSGERSIRRRVRLSAC